eukprot:6175177-Pleurochrysis_carterae.AAC.3
MRGPCKSGERRGREYLDARADVSWVRALVLVLCCSVRIVRCFIGVHARVRAREHARVRVGRQTRLERNARIQRACVRVGGRDSVRTSALECAWASFCVHVITKHAMWTN